MRYIVNMNSRDIVAIITSLSSLGVAYYQSGQATEARSDVAEITDTLSGALQATADACKRKENG